MTHRVPQIGEIWINELNNQEVVKIAFSQNNYWFWCHRYIDNKFTEGKWVYNKNAFKTFVYDERLNNELIIKEIIE